jgi:uncharacterized membrane protein YgaE (UPF0421/DUF939 family)
VIATISLRSGADAAGRVRVSFWPVVQTAIAASLAWWFARRALGHAQPFFAPIAAAISLSSTHIQRSRRIVQMVVGVLLGIGIGIAVVTLFGTSTGSVGLAVLATMLACRLFGAGFVGEGMMFVNQSAASALLIVTLHRAGVGSERAVDVLVGGASAFFVGVVLFPAAPLPRLHAAERAVLSTLASALSGVVDRLAGGQPMDPGWTQQLSFEIHAQLGALAAARATARVNVRVAPRRWLLRAIVDREEMRIARLDLLANAVLSLVRATTGALDEMEPLGPELRRQLLAVAAAVRELAAAEQPWPPELLESVGNVASDAIDHVQARAVDRTPVIESILRSAARDLQTLIMTTDAL